MRKQMSSSLVGLLTFGLVVLSTAVTANAVADPLPFSCTTVDSKGGGNNYKVEAITGDNGEFPLTAACPDDASKQCADFGYTVSSLSGDTVSHSFFAASADYAVQEDPSASENVYAPGQGDPQSGFLEYAMHEKVVKFNSNATTFEGHIFVEGDAVAGATTAYIQGGKNNESCLIAGPGSVRTLDNVWVPKTSSKNVNVLHGACDATLHYNGKGDLVNITLGANSACYTGKIPPNAKAAIGGEPIQDVNAPDGISFGNHSTIMYLPSGWAICTATPCPGTTTYVFTY
ncbi:MAG: hypothetical protein P8X48_03300 [Acidiferrobacteraceae bacterium]|jgi:hypothetical protein